MADKKISALPAATTPLAGTEVLPIVQSGVTDKVSVANLTAGRAVSMLSGTITDTNANPVGLSVNNNSPSTAAGTRVNWQFNGSTVGYVGNQFDGSDFVNLYNANRAHKFSVGATETMTIFGGNVTASVGNFVVGTAGKGIDFSANTPATGMTGQTLTWYEEGNYTPTVAATTGTITSYTATAYYTRVGRQVTLTTYVVITNAGTGAGTLTITLPFTANGNIAFSGTGRENALTGVALQANITAGGTVVNVVNYANATVIATNAQVRNTITYFV